MDAAKSFLTYEISQPMPQALRENLKQVLETLEKGWFSQVGSALLTLVKREELQKGDDLWKLYTNVIEKIESNLEPLKLVAICFHVSNYFKNDVIGVTNFLKNIGECVNANIDARVMIKVQLGEIEMREKNLEAAISFAKDFETDLEKVCDIEVKLAAEKLKSKISNGKKCHISFLSFG